MIKLNPDERLLIESGINQYKLIGPGWVWINPWQRALTKVYIGPQGQSLQFSDVRTVENIPVDVTIQVLYQVDPALFSADLLPKVPWLNIDGWQDILKWRTEHILRQLLTDYTWRDLGREILQQRLERRLPQTLAGYLMQVGLKLISICLIKTELPAELQRTLIQTERDRVEPQGRVAALKEYFEIFGHNLSQAMPYIIQWELLNIVRKKGNPQLLLASDLTFEPSLPNAESSQPVFQMELPLSQAS